MKKSWKISKNISILPSIIIMMNFLLSISQLFSYNFFSPLYRKDKLNVTMQQQEFELRDKPLIINSLSVKQDSLLIDVAKYKVDFDKGKITFFEPLGIVAVEYQIVPPELLDKIYLYETQVYTDTSRIKKPRIRKNLFASDTRLNITGSKTIAVSVANNEDFSLDQSLFLKLDGEISNNLNIEAQLSDSQSPITPEGDSREISSLDKIFLRLYGRQYELAFGDLQMEFKGTEFINFAPQFEGLKAAWHDKHKAQGALAISKGKQTTINFSGLDGKQGPYYLYADQLPGVQVVPGSEYVYLNGEPMQRGDDYTIDYSEGSITFSNSHFISAVSQIQVAFQYADENYRQNMYLASSSINLTDRLELTNFIVLQNDDKNNPLQDELSESDLEDLKAAGDNQAWGNGVTPVEDGLYKLSAEGYYYYVGNDTTQTGNYNIHFEYIGQGNGDYEYEPIGDYYLYVGEQAGSYLPIKKLRAPEQLANYDIYARYNTDELLLKAEGIFSQFDKNTISSLDDDDNNGFAGHLLAEYKPDLDKIKPQIELQYRNIGNNLNTFADLNSAVQSYEFEQIPDTLANASYSGRFGLELFEIYRPELILKRTNASGFADQDYLSFSSRIFPAGFRPAFQHRYFEVDQVFEENQILAYNVKQHDLNSSWGYSFFEGKVNFLQKESIREFQAGLANTQKQKNLGIKLTISEKQKFSTELNYMIEDMLMQTDTDSTTLIESDTRTMTTGLESNFNSTNHRINLSVSNQQVENEKINEKKSFNMASISSNNTLLKKAIHINSSYSLKNVEFYPKIREFLFVGEDLGSYDVDTVYVGLGEGDYDWEVVSIDYDDPQMSVEVNAAASLNLNPAMLTSSYLNRFRSETFLQVTENSSLLEENSVFLLDPAYLMDKETTLYGRNIQQQTIWYDILPRKLSSRTRYRNEKTLDNRYNNESDETKTVNWETQLDLKLIKNFAVELVYESHREEESRYESEVDHQKYAIDFRNRISQDLSLKTSIGYTEEEGKKSDQSNRYKIRAAEIEETVTYYLNRKYRFFGRFEFVHNERSGSEYLGFLADKKDGNIFKWKLNFDYKVNSYTSAALVYSGNSYPAEKDEHKLSVEVKAEF